MKPRKSFTLFCFIASLCSAVAVAVLPPDVAEEYQKNSPEKAEILITRVTTEFFEDEYSGYTTVIADAKVESTFWSQSGLTKGMTIKLH